MIALTYWTFIVFCFRIVSLRLRKASLSYLPTLNGKKNDGKLELPLHLYLRIRQFVRENLLLSSGRIEHDGRVPTADESFSPTTERLIVLRWSEILHPGLPRHVSNVFVHDFKLKV